MGKNINYSLLRVNPKIKEGQVYDMPDGSQRTIVKIKTCKYAELINSKTKQYGKVYVYYVVSKASEKTNSFSGKITLRSFLKTIKSVAPTVAL